MKAQRAVMGSERVVARSDGLVYSNGQWAAPTSPVIKFGEPVVRWVDLPAAWCGVSPWFPSVAR